MSLISIKNAKVLANIRPRISPRFSRQMAARLNETTIRMAGNPCVDTQERVTIMSDIGNRRRYARLR